MNKGRKILSFVIFFLVVLVTIVSSMYIIFKDEDVKGVNIEVGEKFSYPVITNLLPKNGYVGEEYIFVPRISSSNGNDVIVTIVEGPTWLEIDNEGIVRGIPYESGTFKVVLIVKDTNGSSTLIDYIIIENEE